MEKTETAPKQPLLTTGVSPGRVQSPLMHSFIASVIKFLNPKTPEVALKTAWSVVPPPPTRVWMSGGLTQESLVREVMKGVLTLETKYLVPRMGTFVAGRLTHLIPYPRGSRRSPGLQPFTSCSTTLTASLAWMVAGSSKPDGVVLLTQV